MKYFLLLFFIYSIFPQQRNIPTSKAKKFLPFHVSKKSFSPLSYGFYKAIITGTKKNTNKKLINVFKKYGFIHILTPSGIHLSSALIFFRFISVLEFMLIVFLFFYLKSFESYHSMERVLIFRFLFKLFKYLPQKFDQTELCFFLTIILSLALGHFSSNPLSFIYSVLFWGTILIFKDEKLKLFLVLNFTLFFISNLSSANHSPISILINPLMTSIFSSSFPILLLNSFLPEVLQFNTLINFCLDQILGFILLIDKLDPFPVLTFELSTLIIASILMVLNKFKLLALWITFSIFPIANNHADNTRLPSKIINIPHRSEIIKTKGQWIHFVDKKCKFKDIATVCVEKPSRWGGPIF